MAKTKQKEITFQDVLIFLSKNPDHAALLFRAMKHGLKKSKWKTVEVYNNLNS